MNDGREKTPEDMADEIINSSDESIGDLIESGGTEVDLSDEELGMDDESTDLVEEIGGDADESSDESFED